MVVAVGQLGFVPAAVNASGLNRNQSLRNRTVVYKFRYVMCFCCYSKKCCKITFERRFFEVIVMEQL